MKTLLAQLDKEIAKASKAFRKACDTMESLRSIPLRELTQKQKDQFAQASEDYTKYDKILTALYTSKERIESAINY